MGEAGLGGSRGGLDVPSADCRAEEQNVRRVIQHAGSSAPSIHRPDRRAHRYSKIHGGGDGPEGCIRISSGESSHSRTIRWRVLETKLSLAWLSPSRISCPYRWLIISCTICAHQLVASSQGRSHPTQPGEQAERGRPPSRLVDVVLQRGRAVHRVRVVRCPALLVVQPVGNLHGVSAGSWRHRGFSPKRQ